MVTKCDRSTCTRQPLEQDSRPVSAPSSKGVFGMRHAMTGIGLGAALTLSCLAGATGAAHADSAESSRLYAPSSLVLIIGKGTDATSSAVQRAVLLRCAPTPGGDHPSPAQACADLNAAQGDFNALAAATDPTKFCPMLWDPVVITAV